MTSRDLAAENAALRKRVAELEAALRAKTAQARRLAEDLDDAECATRVYRRALLRVLCPDEN